MKENKINVLVSASDDSDKDHALPKFGKKIMENAIAEVSSDLIGTNILNLVRNFDELLAQEKLQTTVLDLDSVELNCVIGADGSVNLIGNIGVQVSSSIKIKLTRKPQ